MKRSNITNEEIGALLGSFSDLRKELSAGITQATSFKAALAISNIYIFMFTCLFFLIRENIVPTFTPNLIAEDFLDIFGGKAIAAFWIFTILNISLYFNFSFNIVSLCATIYIVSSVFDLVALFHERISFQETFYLTLLITTSPVLIFSMVFMVFTHKASVETL